MSGGRSTTKANTFCTLALLAVCLLGLATGSAGAASPLDQVTVENATHRGPGVVATGNTTYVWASEPHTVSVELQTGYVGEGRNEVCLWTEHPGTGTKRQLACRSRNLPANATTSVNLSVKRWPAKLTGNQTLRVTVNESEYVLTPIAEAEFPVHVVRKEGDLDSDGLPNRLEVDGETNFDAADTDGDGLGDRVELRERNTDPLAPDSDGDGLRDGLELRHGTDPLVNDSDGDELRDGPEVHQFGTNPLATDSDSDGLDDPVELEENTQPSQADSDSDGLDDPVELRESKTNPLSADSDGDGLDDGVEHRVSLTDPNDGDSDGDGLGDRVELRERNTDPLAPDSDSDGLHDGDEVANATDPLAADADGDGLPDGVEVPAGIDPANADTDGDLLDDDVERGLGTDPASAANPLGTALAGALVACSGAGLLVLRSRGTSLQEVVGDAALARVADGDGPDAGRGNPPTAVAGPPTDATDPDPLPPIMTDEDRVVRLLHENGGRLRQSAITDRTEWSKSKVSRLLSKMAEEDKVTKVNVGRENLITLSGDEPEAAKTPFEE